MIVRILGEGQFELPDSAVAELNVLDAALEESLTDDAAFRTALAALLGRVREAGTQVDPALLAQSDVVLPSAEAEAPEVAAMLTEEGLIPD